MLRCEFFLFTDVTKSFRVVFLENILAELKINIVRTHYCDCLLYDLLPDK